MLHAFHFMTISLHWTPVDLTHIKLSFLLAISKRRLAEPLYSLYRNEDSCNLLRRSLSDVAPGTNVRYQRVPFTFTRNLDRPRQPSPCCLSYSWICEVFSKLGPELEWLFFHQFVYIMWEGWEMGSVTSATECKDHLSCNCDFVVRYNNIQHANANIAGNGDHTNSAVAPTKTYKSVKDYPELSVVNQNQVVTISDVCDLHLKGLERNGSPNPNSMGYKLLPCFTRRPQVVVTLAFPAWSLETKAVFYLACRPRDIATGNVPWLAACVHSLKKPLSLISCITMPAAKSALLWPYVVVVSLSKAYHLKWIIS